MFKVTALTYTCILTVKNKCKLLESIHVFLWNVWCSCIISTSTLIGYSTLLSHKAWYSTKLGTLMIVFARSSWENPQGDVCHIVVAQGLALNKVRNSHKCFHKVFPGDLTQKISFSITKKHLLHLELFQINHYW